MTGAHLDLYEVTRYLIFPWLCFVRKLIYLRKELWTRHEGMCKWCFHSRLSCKVYVLGDGFFSLQEVHIWGTFKAAANVQSGWITSPIIWPIETIEVTFPNKGKGWSNDIVI